MRKEETIEEFQIFAESLFNINNAFSLSKDNLQRLQEMVELKRKRKTGFQDFLFRRRLSFKINQRVEELKSKSVPKDYTLFTKPEKGFIHPRSEIWQGLWKGGFCLDDNSIYLLLIENLASEDKLGSAKKLSPQILAESIQKTVSQYFGEPDVKNEREISKLFPSRWVSNRPISVTRLKGKSLGFCGQWSAMTNNLMAFSGIDCSLVLSPSCEFGRKIECFHSYLILQNEDKRFIYDPINPFYIFENNKKIGSIPSIYPISDTQFFKNLTGKIQERKPVEVTYTTFIKNGNFYGNGKALRLAYSGTYPTLG